MKDDSHRSSSGTKPRVAAACGAAQQRVSSNAPRRSKARQSTAHASVRAREPENLGLPSAVSKQQTQSGHTPLVVR